MNRWTDHMHCCRDRGRGWGRDFLVFLLLDQCARQVSRREWEESQGMLAPIFSHLSCGHEWLWVKSSAILPVQAVYTQTQPLPYVLKESIFSLSHFNWSINHQIYIYICVCRKVLLFILSSLSVTFHSSEIGYVWRVREAEKRLQLKKKKVTMNSWSSHL